MYAGICKRLASSGKPQITVRKLSHDGHEVYSYPGWLLWATDSVVMLAARFRMGDISLGGLFMGMDDCFVETYYANRWYNVLAVHARENGRLRGWYVNIGAPHLVTTSVVSYRDLALDLVVLPNGSQKVLDVDEFAALPLPPHERRRALMALEEAQARFRRCLASA